MEKPSFFDNVKAGVIGMIKGAAALTLIGIAVGAGAGAILGAVSTGGSVLAGSVVGAVVLGKMGFTVGSIIGTVTGVMQNNESRATDPQDVINLANIAFAQGVEVGKSKDASPESLAELSAAKREFQDKLAAEKSTGHSRHT